MTHSYDSTAASQSRSRHPLRQTTDGAAAGPPEARTPLPPVRWAETAHLLWSSKSSKPMARPTATAAPPSLFLSPRQPEVVEKVESTNNSTGDWLFSSERHLRLVV